MIRRPPRSTRTDTLFPYTTLFRSDVRELGMFDHGQRRFDHCGALVRIRLATRLGEPGVGNFPPAFGRNRRQALEQRSEEHTSELQSLMRISYAVFCLKKKKNTANHIQHTTKRHTTQYETSHT